MNGKGKDKKNITKLFFGDTSFFKKQVDEMYFIGPANSINPAIIFSNPSF